MPDLALSELFGSGAVTPAPGLPLTRAFTADNLAVVRHALRAGAHATGLTGEPLDDFVTAAHELITNAVRHGGGHGRLALRLDGDSLICDVTDDGPGFAGAVPTGHHLPAPLTPGGRGLWLARQMTDTLLISDSPTGVTVTVTVCLPAVVAPPLLPGTPEAVTGLSASAPATPHSYRTAARHRLPEIEQPEA